MASMSTSTQEYMEAIEHCYYVTSADRIIGIKRIDLDVDPPPDIAVEIDITKDSLSEFHIYAALKIPEIWRYDGKNVQRIFHRPLSLKSNPSTGCTTKL